MTRTIMTAAELEALPVGAGFVDKHGDLGLVDERDGVRCIQYAETETMSVRRAARYLPATLLHDPSAPAPVHVCTTHCEQGRGHYPAPVVPVVSDAAVSRGLAQSAAGETVDLGDFTQYLIPDAAVEAAARAIHAEGWTCEAHEPEGLDECEQCATSTPRLARAVLSAALPFLGAAPSATREDVETITVPRPHVPHGPATVAWDVADADYLRRAARDLEEFYRPFGSNLRATIVALIRDAADAITPRTDR